MSRLAVPGSSLKADPPRTESRLRTGICARIACTNRQSSHSLWDKSWRASDRHVVRRPLFEAPPLFVINLRRRHVPVPEQILHLDDVYPYSCRRGSVAASVGTVSGSKSFLQSLPVGLDSVDNCTNRFTAIHVYPSGFDKV